MKTIEVKKPSGYATQIGPAHPALKEPIMFSLGLEGEKIVKCDFTPGMAHRGIEWMGMRRNCIQVVYLAERICGLCGITHAIAYCRAIEQIAQMTERNTAAAETTAEAIHRMSEMSHEILEALKAYRV